MFAPKFEKQLSPELEAARNAAEKLQIKAQIKLQGGKEGATEFAKNANNEIRKYNAEIVAQGYSKGQQLCLVSTTGNLIPA